MNTYDTLMKKITTWAQHTENIRALAVIGSRARKSQPADEWSDLDLLVITTNMNAYIESAEWLQEFGAPLLSFTEPTFDGSFERRALFDGFLDVDFALSEPEQFKESLKFGAVRDIFQRGCTILLDKDDWTKTIANLTPPPPRPPLSAAELRNDIQDYWFHVVWTTKKLQRGELWSAMNCLNCYMKNKLLHLIEAYTILFEGGEIDTWHNGRLLENWSSPTITQRLPGSFSDYDTHALAAALQHQMSLYHDLAAPISAKLDIPYPYDAVQAIQSWLM
jgi:aminoglycoside 6-adenylyltransferase